MGIFDLYSKRQKRLRGDVPDVYEYDEIPDTLRVQIVHIVQENIGTIHMYNAKLYDRSRYPSVREVYNSINKILCREYGVFELVEKPSRLGIAEDLFQYFLNLQDHEKVLDVIELLYTFIDGISRNYDYLQIHNADDRANAAINEINNRFKEHGIGYEYKSGEIIRVDSEFIHAEVVKPALALLAGKIYENANKEFLQAHEHYRHRHYKDSLTWALKAVESTMKAICAKRGWDYDKNAPAKRLIEICFDKGLIPSFWQSHFAALRTTLESGVPTARNKMGGHGDGTNAVIVPPYLASYCLHMTASTLVFLIEAEKDFK